MDECFLKIAGFGLIGEDAQGGPFRQVIFKDTKREQTCDLLVFKKERPSLWADIEKLERGGQIPPYRGEIVKYNSFDLILFSGENIENAFARQRRKLKITDRISYSDAETKRTNSLGYITNLTNNNAMEINWRAIDKNALLVKFRTYNKNGTFLWTDWFEIVNRH